MTTSVLRGRLVLEDTVVEDGIIEFDGATITRVCPVSEYEGEVPEASDATYLPGLVDGTVPPGVTRCQDREGFFVPGLSLRDPGGGRK